MIPQHELEPLYKKRIDALHKTKVEHNQRKLETGGYHDIDDHGCIPWSEPIPFEPISNHPDGGCYGMKCIGENFRRWLEVHPVYIHPLSALAGAWVKAVPKTGGWRPEDKPTHLYPFIEECHIYGAGYGGMNHIGPDMAIGLDLGWGGLLKKIRHYREANEPADTSFYDGEESLVLGVQAWIEKHVLQAREMAARERDPATKENLLEIADMNEWLVDNPPRTLREACQFLAWFQSIDRMWASGGALQQLDELLRPYYEADKAAGRITDDEVIWDIASLFFNDTHYSQIGGLAPDGRDLTSPMSFLILEAMHQLLIPANIALRVHDDMNPELLRRAVQYLFEDGTGVCYSCAKGLDEGFARNGLPIQVARMRAKVGCNWTALPGIEYCLQDVTRISLVSPLLRAFDDVVSDGNIKSLETLWERFAYHLNIGVDTIKRGIDWHVTHHAQNTGEIVLNLFCHGPIERGLDVVAGGLDIYNYSLDALGLATVADSLAAIEQRVVKEKLLTWEELAQHLANDFQGAENVRLMLKNIPHYGTGNSCADKWAKRVSDLFTHLVKDTRMSSGFNLLPGLFSHGDIRTYGRVLGATPDGRHAGTPISHSANPNPAFVKGGVSAPTAKAAAVAATQSGWGNSSPLQLDIDKHLVAEHGGVEAVEALIKTHNAQGGTLININVLSKEQLLEAHEDPNRYPELLVRVTGYSAFFKSLSREYRQQIVDRFLAEENS